MIQLNLLPDVKKEFIKSQRTRNTVIAISTLVTIGAGAITALLLLYVFVAQPVTIGFQTDQIKKNSDTLKAIPEIDKYLTVQNQLANIEDLHTKKVLYSRIFGYLQQLNPAAPNNIALSSVTIDKETKMIEVQGVSRNFQALNVFQNTLENATVSYRSNGQDGTVDLFADIVLQEASLGTVNGTTLANFKLQLTYNEAVFATTSSNIKLNIPNLVTSDADRNAPKQVFGSQPEGTQ